jgi:hypothetical protein
MGVAVYKSHGLESYSRAAIILSHHSVWSSKVLIYNPLQTPNQIAPTL